MLHFYPLLRSERRLFLRLVHSAEPHGDPSLPSKCIQPSWPSLVLVVVQHWLTKESL